MDYNLVENQSVFVKPTKPVQSGLVGSPKTGQLDLIFFFENSGKIEIKNSKKN
jgi:hypothetical protein